MGRRSRTQVDVLYLEGIADPETVERLRRRLDNIDIDGVEAAGNLEEYLVDHLNTPSPPCPTRSVLTASVRDCWRAG